MSSQRLGSLTRDQICRLPSFSDGQIHVTLLQSYQLHIYDYIYVCIYIYVYIYSRNFKSQISGWVNTFGDFDPPVACVAEDKATREIPAVTLAGKLGKIGWKAFQHHPNQCRKVGWKKSLCVFPSFSGRLSAEKNWHLDGWLNPKP